MISENKIICGAMPEATKVFPDGYFNCSISSPPYWALRDYGVDGQLGLEPTFEEYIDKLCTIYDEVKRVLRNDGTCWVNLGDTYNNATPGARDAERWPKQSRNNHTPAKRPPATVQTKSLCLIPQRFAIEMVNRGWILRNVLIWHKPNPMPSSAKDRFTVDFEYIYFFVKSKKYWFEQQFESYSPNSDMEYRKTLRLGKFYRAGNQNPYKDNTPLAGDRKMTPLAEGKNMRTVWTIPTQPYPEAHFATFPEKLVEPMIKAGCPEFVCNKCGKGREKIFEPNEGGTIGHDWAEGSKAISGGLIKGNAKVQGSGDYYKTYQRGKFKGYTDCGCKAEWRPGRTLDCFRGHGHGWQGGRQVAA